MNKLAFPLFPKTESKLTNFTFKTFALLFCIFSFPISTQIQAKDSEVVISDVNVPWGMLQLSPTQWLVSEREGELLLFDLVTNKKHKITNLPEISDRGQGGLLDLELHPNYKTNGWIYFSYSSPDGDGWGSNTAIMRAKIKDYQLISKELIYKAVPNTMKGQHFGSRIEFDRDGFLYFSVGDRGDRDSNPQDLERDAGKIYRLHDDGRIPKDNPFTKNSKPAIYSYGHRNPQGMAMHPVTGEIWTHEHGPKGGDEINIIAKGKNYGWPVISYGVNYIGTKFTDLTHKEGMEQPAWYWVPSIAPSGMTFVTSDKYPKWKGQLLVGSLKFGYLVLCKLENNKVVSQQIVHEGIGRTRNVKQMPDGYIYAAVEGKGIVRLEAE
jgi:glucose/arabinose dehydrogenase